VPYEVFRRVRREGGEERALLAAAHLREGTVVPPTDRVALLAAEPADEYRLSMADAFVYAHARVAGVEYHGKRVPPSPPESPDQTA